MGRILITGGSGFIGASIVKRLLDDGDVPIVFDLAPSTGKMELLGVDPARVTFIKGRVDAPEFVQTVVDTAPDAIIHLAGLQMPTCKENPVLGAQVNVIGTLNVFEAAKALQKAGRPLPRIVYASSAAVFGPDAEYGEQVRRRPADRWPGCAASHVMRHRPRRASKVRPPTQAVGDNSVPKPASHYGAYKVGATSGSGANACTSFEVSPAHLPASRPSPASRPLLRSCARVRDHGRQRAVRALVSRYPAHLCRRACLRTRFRTPQP